MTLLNLKTKYDPSFKEIVRLEKFQDWFRATDQAIFVDVKFDKYQYIIRRGQLASRLRSKWEVLNGGNLAENIPANEETLKEG